jgi:uncharacterized membrane protein (DUF373 family)
LLRSIFSSSQVRRLSSGRPTGSTWFDASLITLLDRLLLIFIALEVLQNVTAYVRDQVVQIELVLLTALTAVPRKVIVLPPGYCTKAPLMAGFGLILVGLGAAYWLVRRTGHEINRIERTPELNSEGPWPGHDERWPWAERVTTQAGGELPDPSSTSSWRRSPWLPSGCRWCRCGTEAGLSAC